MINGKASKLGLFAIIVLIAAAIAVVLF